MHHGKVGVSNWHGSGWSLSSARMLHRLLGASEALGSLTPCHAHPDATGVCLSHLGRLVPEMRMYFGHWENVTFDL